MTAASPGGLLKLKVPPKVPEIDAFPPSQVGVMEKVGSSFVPLVAIVTGISNVVPQAAFATCTM